MRTRRLPSRSRTRCCDQRARPRLANWLERTGHRRGYVQIRWQRLTRELRPGDGPQVEVVKFAGLPEALPYHEQARVTRAEYAARIAARQAAVAARMLG